MAPPPDPWRPVRRRISRGDAPTSPVRGVASGDAAVAEGDDGAADRRPGRARPGPTEAAASSEDGAARPRPRLRVLVVTAAPLLAVGLRVALRAHGLEITGVARTLLRPERAPGELPATDHVLLTITENAGPAVTEVLALGLPDPPLTALLPRTSLGIHGQRLAAAGHVTVLPLETPIDRIVEAIRAPPRAGAHRLAATTVVRGPGGALTPREQQVLDALGRGGRNREIGERLQISEETVKAHLSQIYRKLDVHGRAEAVTAFWQASGG